MPNRDNNWQTPRDYHEIPPSGAFGIRHLLFLAVILAIPIAAREYETLKSRIAFVSLVIAISILFAIVTNYRRYVSWARVISSIAAGIAIYATTITLLIDKLSSSSEWGPFGHLGIAHAGILGFAAMCGIIMIIAALV